jgi:methyl-accepting chemotaxis protein
VCIVLSKLSIAQRIYGAFGALIALLAVVCVAGFFGVQAVSGIFSDFRRAAGETLTIGRMVGELTATRLIEAHYRESADPALADSFATEISHMGEYVAAARAEFAGNAGALAVLEDLDADRAAYAAAFGRTVKLENERVTLLANLQGHVEAARAALGRVMEASSTAGHTAAVVEAGKASDSILQMLLHAERLVADGEAAHQEHIAANGTAAKSALSGLSAILGMFRPQLAALADTAAAEIESYLGEARALADLTAERDRLRAEQLDVIGPRMQVALHELNETVVEREHELGVAGEQRACDGHRHGPLALRCHPPHGCQHAAARRRRPRRRA